MNNKNILINKSDKSNKSNILEESIVIDKYTKKLPSDLSQSFIVIDHDKKLSQMNQKEQTVISEQDNLHNYTEMMTTIETNPYIKLFGIVKWLIL